MSPVKFEEYRPATPADIRTPLPKSEARPCMRGTLDLEHYNRTGETVMIEPLTEFIPPVSDEEAYARETKARMKVVVNANKPSKDRLEQDLRDGLTLQQIGDKYAAKVATVSYWIKGYALQGTKGKAPSMSGVLASVRSGMAETRDTSVTQDDMIQKSPTLAEVEQFHTDEPLQELPVVEMYRPVNVPGQEITETDKPLLITMEAAETKGTTAEENMTDEEWMSARSREYTEDHPATIGELWEDVEVALTVLHSRHQQQADEDFRAELTRLVVAVTSGRA